MAPGAVSTRVILCHDLLRHSPRLTICPPLYFKNWFPSTSTKNSCYYHFLHTLQNFFQLTKTQLTKKFQLLLPLPQNSLQIALKLPKPLTPSRAKSPSSHGGAWSMEGSRCRSNLAPARMSFAESRHARGGFPYLMVAQRSSVPSGMKF